MCVTVHFFVLIFYFAWKRALLPFFKCYRSVRMVGIHPVMQCVVMSILSLLLPLSYSLPLPVPSLSSPLLFRLFCSPPPSSYSPLTLLLFPLPPSSPFDNPCVLACPCTLRGLHWGERPSVLPLFPSQQTARRLLSYPLYPSKDSSATGSTAYKQPTLTRTMQATAIADQHHRTLVRGRVRAGEAVNSAQMRAH